MKLELFHYNSDCIFSSHLVATIDPQPAELASFVMIPNNVI